MNPMMTPETSMYELGMYLGVFLLAIVVGAIILGVLTLPFFYIVLFGVRLVLTAFQVTGLRIVSFLQMMFRNITRSLLRTSLIYVAIFVLTFVISGLWTILNFLDKITEDREANFKAIITEKYQFPSQMKPAFEREVIEIANKLPPHLRPRGGTDDVMTWSFVGGTLDVKNQNKENSLFFFVMEPKKLLTMMDGLDELTGAERALLDQKVHEMEDYPRGVVIGKERLKLMHKQVGDRLKLTSINYTGLEFDLEIIGEFPQGQYDQSAVMNRVYLENMLKEYERKNGSQHPLADKSLALIWIRLPNKEAFETMAAEINKTGRFSPAIKMETASAAFGTFLDPHRDMLWAMKYFLSPVLLVIITLIVSIPVSLGVRERRTEMAVLKVLGFKPWQVLAIILGEALTVGVLSGGISTTLIFVSAKVVKFPIAFFPQFMIPIQILIWGPTIGGITAFIGSIVPAWLAQKTKASEVFSRVA